MNENELNIGVLIERKKYCILMKKYFKKEIILSSSSEDEKTEETIKKDTEIDEEIKEEMVNFTKMNNPIHLCF